MTMETPICLLVEAHAKKENWMALSWNCTHVRTEVVGGNCVERGLNGIFSESDEVELTYSWCGNWTNLKILLKWCRLGPITLSICVCSSNRKQRWCRQRCVLVPMAEGWEKLLCSELIERLSTSSRPQKQPLVSGFWYDLSRQEAKQCEYLIWLYILYNLFRYIQHRNGSVGFGSV